MFPSADKKAKKDKHQVGQKKQQKANKGSDADSDVSSGDDGYLDSKEMDCLSDSSLRLLKPSIPISPVIVDTTAVPAQYIVGQ